jgi:hypothetical protein
VPATSALVLLKWMFHKLMCGGQSTSLRYLWFSLILGCFRCFQKGKKKLAQRVRESTV